MTPVKRGKIDNADFPSPLRRGARGEVPCPTPPGIPQVLNLLDSSRIGGTGMTY